MAAANRPTRATYEVHETVRVDTLDNEDHTFCGIMFPIKAKEILPVDRIVIRSIAVRGQLGPMTVWVTNDTATPDPRTGEYRFRLHPRHWTKVYERTHSPSSRNYVALQLDDPVVLRPGQIRAVYVHSQLEGDEAIVYDNSRGLALPGLPDRNNNGGGGMPGQPGAAASSRRRWEDSRLAILSGKAHLSNVPFDQTPIWGWGDGWRDRREFVGQIEYGVVYQLWHPERHLAYGDQFRAAAIRLLTGQQRRPESVLATLPDECVYYILHMCRWDWFGDTADGLQLRRRLLRARRRQLEREVRDREQRNRRDRRLRRLARHRSSTAPPETGLAVGPPHAAANNNAAAAAASMACVRDACRRAREGQNPSGVGVPGAAALPAAAANANDDDDNDSDFEPESDDHDDDDDDEANEANEDGDATPQVAVGVHVDRPGVAVAGAEVCASNRPAANQDNSSSSDDDDDDNNNGNNNRNANNNNNPRRRRPDAMESDSDNDSDDSNDSNESEWERANGYRADGTMLTCRDVSSDEDDENDAAADTDAARDPAERGDWFRRNLARIRILRALAGGAVHDPEARPAR